MMWVDIKIILLGAAGVGKTSIYVRYFEHSWNRLIHRSTIGQDVKFKQYTPAGTDDTYTIAVWDTAGSERYDSLTPIVYRDADFAVLCFDPAVPASWAKVLYWHDELHKNNENCRIIICATKLDLFSSGELTYEVDRKHVERFCTEKMAAYVHVSSKTGENVDTLFLMMINKLLNDEAFRARRTERFNNRIDDEANELRRNEVIRAHNSCC